MPPREEPWSGTASRSSVAVFDRPSFSGDALGHLRRGQMALAICCSACALPRCIGVRCKLIQGLTRANLWCLAEQLRISLHLGSVHASGNRVLRFGRTPKFSSSAPASAASGEGRVRVDLLLPRSFKPKGPPAFVASFLWRL